MATEENSSSTSVQQAHVKAHWFAAYDTRAAALGLPLATESDILDIRDDASGTLRATLDAEIEGLRSVLIAALASRNRLSIANTLPCEILGIIFRELADKLPVGSSSGLGLKSLGWVVITHVSRRWRSTAIHYPMLWSNLALDVGQSWPTFLERSQDAPLSIRGDWTAESGDRCWSHVGTHRRRIDTMELANALPRSVRKIEHILQEPFPSLRSLYVSRRNDTRVDYRTYELHGDFLRVIVPNIVHLCLDSSGFPIGTSATLRSLRLSRCSIDPSKISCTLDEILHTLRNLPALEVLSLQNMLPLPVAGHVIQKDPISLPSLKQVFIDDHAFATDLWMLLDAHPAAEVTVSSSALDEDAELSVAHSIDAPLRKFTRTVLDNLEDPDISLKVIFDADRTEITLRTREEDTSCTVAPDIALHYIPSSISLVFTEYDRINHSAILLSLVNAIPMRLITYLSLAGRCRPRQRIGNVYSVFSNAKSVMSLDLAGEFTRQGLEYLTPADDHETCLPKLRHLRLEHVSLEDRIVQAGDFRAGPRFIDMLNRALDERYRCNDLYLASITFKHCELSETLLAGLRAPGRWGGQTWVNWDTGLGMPVADQSSGLMIAED
ncbi:hypothetical protein PENSPDRAFT_685614 [Peniophora sp. CONT]|nr:hypothetical protein PENSPDRAFT_685614 [Peniophora sp. CONT]